ncbi:MAG TPA: hypothetical protein VGV12_00770 [Gemmatimonadales bacterium]|nr:hypothetical protein [Gemmatimonadales bacterium]
MSEGVAGKKIIVATFDLILARTFPALHPQLALVLRIEGHGTEEGKHHLRIDFVDADYKNVVAPIELDFEMIKEGRPASDAPLAAEVVVNANGLPVPHEGNYEFAVQVDGRHLGAIPLYVREAPA